MSAESSGRLTSQALTSNVGKCLQMSFGNFRQAA